MALTQINQMDAFPGPRKKQRVEKVDDDLEWGHEDDITPDVIAQVDFVASQAFSQLANAPTIPVSHAGTPAFQRHHSWTASPNENLLPSRNSSRSKPTLLQTSRLGANNQKPVESKSWTSASSFVGQNFSQVSPHEVERLRQELKNLREEKVLHEKQLKQLDEVISKKDFEIQGANEKFDSLKQQSVIEENRLQAQLQEIERLKTELGFKCQELASVQWKVCQQQSRSNSHSNGNKLTPSSGSQPKTKIFKSPLKVTKDSQCFPSQSTFSKRLALNVEDASNDAKKARTTSSPTVEQCLVNNPSILNLKRPLGIETGPGLVRNLLRWTNASKPGLPANSVNANMRTSLNDVSAKCLAPEALNVVSILDTFLEDGASVNERKDTFEPEFPPEFCILKMCLGLRPNCAEVMLPTIERALSVPASGTFKRPIPSDCRRIEPSLKTSMQDVVGTLRVLGQLTYCSPKIRHRLVFSDAGIINGAIRGTPEHFGTPQPGPSHRVSPTIVHSPKPLFHPVFLKLFELCSRPLEFRCNLEANLLQLSLETIRTIASDCPNNEFDRFLPLLTPRMVQNCTSLALDGIVLLEFASLLGILCTNPIFVEGTCNRDDFCVWNPLAGAWQKARNKLPQPVMLKLDNLMLEVLSLCLTHENLRTPFLVPGETHCQTEVIAGLVLNLHHQQKLFEEGGRALVSIPMLRKGVTLLHQVANRDANFRRHSAEVNYELFAFLYWLARVKNRMMIGTTANVLLEMWTIEAKTTSESEDDESQMDFQES